ncbi:hypothetical protein G9H71_18465 [Motilibacter sp. E257]|uniref:FIMAH domain-containing protein n=1 Tax=Motilibacter deserti TaxID=2714956 RepID=A0ABX0H2Y5_9ACTN|nr:hypothetical protein [Motilibacter deserti]
MGPVTPNEVAKTANIEHLDNDPKPPGFVHSSATSFFSALNSDLAFQGDYAFSGNYNGFNIYDISEPADPELVTSVLCPGSQNDISVYGDLLVLSTDSPRTNDSCTTGAAGSQNNAAHWEGIKIFDISDIKSPQYIKSVRTDCGSHTHTLAPSKDLEDLYVYVSSYSPSASAAYCKPPHDKISIVKVPLDAPTDAAIVSTPVLFPDGGNPGKARNPADPTSNSVSATSGCHDLTTFPSRDVMAGACMGDGALFDISNRENPTLIHSVRDDVNFSFWHSASFNNAGTKVVFTDELGGGGQATCDYDPNHGLVKGADAIYDIVDAKMVFKSYFKIPRVQQENENCVAHNGSLIPVKGKDIMVQAWYQGGLSVFDFTDSANPKEIAWFDRGPDVRTHPTTGAPLSVTGGNWSTYWYNGHIFSNEIQRGFDSFKLTDPMFADAAKVKSTELNVQMQQLYTEAVSFQSLYDMVDMYVASGNVTASASASLKDRLAKVDAAAAKGSEAQSISYLESFIAKAKNQIKGDAADIAARDALVSAAGMYVADLTAADKFER